MSSTQQGSETEAVEVTPGFQKFLALVKSKGVFDKYVEGTPEYDKCYQSVLQKYKQRQEARSSKSKEDLAAADALKEQGNAALKAGEFAKAVELYTSALEASSTGPNAHLYYCNRAAARKSLGDFEGMATDCAAAIALKPDYAKAHMRNASALLALGR